MSPMLIDSIVGIIVLLSAIFAFLRGFVRELLTIVNLLGAAAAAYYFGPDAIPFMNEQFGVKEAAEAADEAAKEAAKIWGVVPPDAMAVFCAYASVFFTAFIILTLAGMQISGAIKALGLGPVDKILGFAFGATRGFLLVFLVYLPFAYFMSPQKLPEWTRMSIAGGLFEKTFNWSQEYLADNNEKLIETGDKLLEKGENVSDEIRSDTKEILSDEERQKNP